ncbi:HAT dimerization [Penicillium digitatum]|uniref:HAT dimerization n=1 Tax=Penicillium digitatum TaxID=36651 RepID=A0A7T6XK35_PENDI|nr:HAT dimerization [Penicillium digitatum]QQK42618.1 HAT dimerization [Penicillium digitatum]QQK42843.1 HAT dimerization [Penicillium digitatum]QQK43853.1 HAT dimerization [Penicillium digitatum]QQK44708.1 HAT dimerization [Penicillium digitatum]
MLDGRDIQPRAITDEISQYLDSDTVSDELEAAKEEREEKLSEIEVDPISDTEEQEDELEDKPGDAIEVVIEDRPEDIPEERPLPTSEYGRPCSPSLPPTCTQTRASGRKRKSREDDLFEYH